MEKYKKIIITPANLKNARIKAGLSIRRLGKLSGVTYTYICAFENGLIMTQKVWFKLKKALDKCK